MEGRSIGTWDPRWQLWEVMGSKAIRANQLGNTNRKVNSPDVKHFGSGYLYRSDHTSTQFVSIRRSCDRKSNVRRSRYETVEFLKLWKWNSKAHVSRDSKRRLDIQMMVSCRFIRSHFYRLLFFISNPACCFSAAAGANKQQQKTTDNLYVTFASFVAFVYQMNTDGVESLTSRVVVCLCGSENVRRKEEKKTTCLCAFGSLVWTVFRLSA